MRLNMSLIQSGHISMDGNFNKFHNISFKAVDLKSGVNYPNECMTIWVYEATEEYPGVDIVEVKIHNKRIRFIKDKIGYDSLLMLNAQAYTFAKYLEGFL